MTATVTPITGSQLLRSLNLEGFVTSPLLNHGLASEIYKTVDSVINEQSNWAEAFNNIASKWKTDQQRNLSHSGYFAPYYRNRNGRVNADQKVVYQTCSRFLDDAGLSALASARAEFYPESVRKLDQLLLSALSEISEKMLPIVLELIDVEPQLKWRLFDERGPINSIRVIRYTSDGLAGTNPHVDKSALSCVAHNTDPGAHECLVLAPPRNMPKISDFRPAYSKEGKCAAIFPGAAFARAGYAWLPPTPHAVLPLGSDAPRYSIVGFWLLNGIDLSNFNTAVQLADEAAFLRDYARKACE